MKPVIATGDSPDQSGGGWRMTRLALEVWVLPDEHRLRVEGETDLVLDLPTSMGPTLALNYREPVMSFIELQPDREAAIQINEHQPDVAHARLAHVRFPEPALEGTEVTVGFAIESEGDSFQFKVSEEAALVSWTEGWYPFPVPVPGEPVGAHLVTTPGTKTFHLPDGWRSVSNGHLAQRKDGNLANPETWISDQSVAHSFIAAPFEAAVHSVNDRDVGVYLLGEHPEGAAEQVRALAAALAAMEARFGPYPYSSYAIAEVPDGFADWYASSEQGFVMAASRAFGYAGGNLPLFAHEMAHGWWGNRVPTTGEGSIMVSEALAQYSAVLAIEGVEGPEAATHFLRFSRDGYNRMQSAWGMFEMWRKDQNKPLSQLESGGWQHNLADAKGHWVYHMLRRCVGDALFFETLRGLIREFAGRPMSLNDLRAAFLDAAPPESDLETFFSQWLDRPGAPVIDLDWWTERDGADLSVVVTLTQHTEPYDLSVDLAIDGEAGSEMRSVEIRDRVTRFVFDVPPPGITDVRLDPNHELLLWTPLYGAPPTLDESG